MKLLTHDNFLTRFFLEAGDIILASLLFALSCVPVVTAGAGISGLHWVFLKKRRRSEESVLRLFIRGFCENFRQATTAWLLLASVLLVLYVNRYFWSGTGIFPMPALHVLSTAAGIAVIAAASYLFAVIAAFRNSLGKLITQSFFFAAGHIPTTLVLVGLPLLALRVTLLDSVCFLALIPFWLCAGSGLLTSISSRLLIRVFSPYLPPLPEDSGE